MLKAEAQFKKYFDIFRQRVLESKWLRPTAYRIKSRPQHRLQPVIKACNQLLEILEYRFFPVVGRFLRYTYLLLKYIVILTAQFLSILINFIAVCLHEVFGSLAKELLHYAKTFNTKVEKHVSYEERKNLFSLILVMVMVLAGLLAPQKAEMIVPQAHAAHAALAADNIPAPSSRIAVHPPITSKKAAEKTVVAKLESGKEDVKESAALGPQKIRVKVKSGDTLDRILLDHGLPRETARQVVSSLREVFNPRQLVVGKELELTFDPVQDALFKDQPESGAQAPVMALRSFKIFENVDKDIVVERSEDGSFVSAVIDKPLIRRVAFHSSEVQSSILMAGREVGIPAQVLAEMVDAYSFDIDFERDIRRGDRFDVYYEAFHDEDGNIVKTGNLIRANLNVRGEDLPIYSYRTENMDGPDYFRPDGQSVRRPLLKTPLKYARVSSRFGMRRHPILGYSKMHTGIDFAAPTGTPIRASGDGVVVKRDWYGGYGRYVRIRHNGTFETAYAHMSRFANGVNVGKRVKQGEIIGYVGTSGSSTGPHLHYEILKNGKHVNPSNVKMPAQKILKDGELIAFQLYTKQVDKQVAALQSQKKLAQNVKIEAPKVE